MNLLKKKNGNNRSRTFLGTSVIFVAGVLVILSFLLLQKMKQEPEKTEANIKASAVSIPTMTSSPLAAPNPIPKSKRPSLPPFPSPLVHPGTFTAALTSSADPRWTSSSAPFPRPAINRNRDRELNSRDSLFSQVENSEPAKERVLPTHRLGSSGHSLLENRKVASTDNVSLETKTATVLTPKAQRDYQFFIKAGVGIDYLSFSQSGSETRRLNFASINTGSYSPRFGVIQDKGWGGEFSFASFPSKVQAQTLAGANPRYQWQVAKIEIFHSSPTNWLENESGRFRARCGVQSHRLPYANVNSTNSITMKEKEIMFGSAGVSYLFRIGRWQPQVDLNYSLPLGQKKARENNIQLQPLVTFDGSVGLSYQFSSGLELGAYWYGHWQDYKYKMYSEATGLPDAGTSKYLFSNIEYRIGYIF